MEDNYIDSKATHIAKITLGKEYFDKGKFNFPVDAKEYVTKDDRADVKIWFENKSGQFITCNFLYTSKQACVNDSKDLKAYFQKNFKKGEKVLVKILGEKEFVICKKQSDS